MGTAAGPRAHARIASVLCNICIRDAMRECECVRPFVGEHVCGHLIPIRAHMRSVSITVHSLEEQVRYVCDARFVRAPRYEIGITKLVSSVSVW